MISLLIKIQVIFLIILMTSLNTSAQEKKAASIPPAKVVVKESKNGMLAPVAQFTGTVYYPEVSSVASEVSGIVETVWFEDGQRVKKGEPLVNLNSDLLEQNIIVAELSYKQALSELKKAKLDLNRIQNLFNEETVAEQVYDKHRFLVEGLESKALSLEANIGTLKLELRKKNVPAPFNGIVIERKTNRGEWLARGSIVATVAKDSEMDVIIDVPESIIPLLKKNMEIIVKVGSKEFQSNILAVIPKGNIETRTFPVKIRLKNRTLLMEGMEALVSLPTGEKHSSVLVHRDAVINKFGKTVVFAVLASKALQIPVTVLGYQGLDVGVQGEGLKPGMQIVIKGNERISNGQPLEILNSTAKK